MRVRISKLVSSLLFLLLAAASLVASPHAEARKVDDTPPAFAGLKSATTCIPGPIGGGRTASYNLAWDAASDDFTPATRIVYLVYQATKPGGEDFAAATYTTPAGATTFTTPALPTNQQFYFVVRAIDRAGNVDANTVEREGQNLCV